MVDIVTREPIFGDIDSGNGSGGINDRSLASRWRGHLRLELFDQVRAMTWRLLHPIS